MSLGEERMELSTLTESSSASLSISSGASSSNVEGKFPGGRACMAPIGSVIGTGLGLSGGDRTVATQGELCSVKSGVVVPAVSADDNPLVLGWLVVPRPARWIPGCGCGLGRVGIKVSDRPFENPVLDLIGMPELCPVHVEP